MVGDTIVCIPVGRKQYRCIDGDSQLCVVVVRVEAFQGQDWERAAMDVVHVIRKALAIRDCQVSALL